ncbi:DUF6227 family protein [Streptomyces sp. NPDC050560]|uniref:DUF6227 family protein n=1 Tax=Streptomyces sp. NPDC050560 TaxID=3365630 RepID=UPI0037A6CD8A
MSVPYETAHEAAESPETPDEFLARLLGRALNSFELPAEIRQQLHGAVAYDGALHSAHHSSGMHRETYRHTWLLADGGVLTLWELAYSSGPLPCANDVRDAQYELYADVELLRAATSRLPLPPESGGPEFEVPLVVRLPPVPMPRHTYLADDSPDHARRLLRRAENEDRPGEETLALLRTASAHQITQAFGRPVPGGAAGMGYALYEHAFLLPDGREVSLWEVEHTATPDGRHMCEVYPSEGAARQAMELRAFRSR